MFQGKAAKGAALTLKISRLSALILLIFVACSQITSNPTATADEFIDVQRAVDLARLYCAQAHSTPKEAPRNIIAGELPCRSVKGSMPNACNGQPDNLRVWLITMDGTWLHWGPPLPNGTPTPILMKHCNVVINARTGEMLTLSSALLP